jgi:hypothetical protein
LHWALLPTKNAQQNAVLRYHTPQALSPFWLMKPAAKHVNAHLLSRRHEAGLCCYLVIHMETLLRPLQLFYFYFTDSPS